MNRVWFLLPLLAALALAGCKSEASVQTDPLSQSFSGLWVGDHRNLSCANRSIRFGRAEIIQIRNGVNVPVFRILDSELRGDVAELTLKFGDSAAAMAFGQGKQRDRARDFRLHVTLVNHGDRILVTNAQSERAGSGRRIVSRGERRSIERIFDVRKCPA